MSRRDCGIVLTAIAIAAALCLGHALGRNKHRYPDLRPAQYDASRLAYAEAQAKQHEQACRNKRDWNVAGICASISQADSARIANLRGEIDGRWSHAGVIIGFLTLLAACAAAWFAKRAADETWRSANEAEKSSGAAIDAAISAKEGLKSDRAWLCPDGFDYGPLHGGGLDNVPMNEWFGIFPKWKNFGVTPSLNTRINRQFRFVGYGDPPPIFDREDDHGIGVITGPSQIFQTNIVGLDEQQTVRFRNREIAVAIYCEVRYFDIYSPGIERVSQSCVIAQHQGGHIERGGERAESVSFAPVGVQNTVD